MDLLCRHTYEYTGEETCLECGKLTHDVDWVTERKLQKQWLKENPDAWKTVGWWSI